MVGKSKMFYIFKVVTYVLYTPVCPTHSVTRIFYTCIYVRSYACEVVRFYTPGRFKCVTRIRKVRSQEKQYYHILDPDKVYCLHYTAGTPFQYIKLLLYNKHQSQKNKFKNNPLRTILTRLEQYTLQE